MDLRKAVRGLLCVFGLSFAASSAFAQHTQITGFVDYAGGEHIYYLDANSHLNQQFYIMGTSWQSQDLTATYGGNTANADSPLTSYADANNGQHVFYVDTSGDLNQLYYPGSGTTWYPQDLGTSYSLPGVVGNSLASLINPATDNQNVYYIDQFGHIQNAFYIGTGTAWQDQDLIGLYGGNTAVSGSPLIAFYDLPGGVSGGQHVVYLDSSGNVNQLFYPGYGTTWYPQNLTSLASGAVAAAGTSNLTAYVDRSGDQHIVYEDASNNIDQLIYTPSTNTWIVQNLSSYGGNTPESASHLASYIDATGAQHIAYLDGSQNVNQMFYSSGNTWTTQNLTGAFGGNVAGAGSVLLAFPLYGDAFMIGQHIAYLDGSDNINQLFYPASGGTSWIWQNLTSYGGNAPALVPASAVSTDQ